jgi:hypothetical protein
MGAFAESRSKSAVSAPALVLASAACVAVALLGSLGITVFGHAADGEPVAALALRALKPVATPAPESAQPVATSGLEPSASVIHVTAPLYAGKALLADPSLIEQTAAGPLPRIADDGRSPMQAYAPAVAATAKPRIAIVISGLGIGAKASAAAIEQTPAAVTLAIVGNAGEPQRWIASAREHGHEVLLQVPMEPYDYPDSDPGPNTLRAVAPEEANANRLTATLVRATGYAGMANLQGSRLLADTAAISPVFTFAARRGLMFFALPASGASPRQIADQQKTAYAESFGTIDGNPSPSSIDQRLSELEAEARAKGAAAASASAYPVTLARLKIWADGLSGRGFVLVPASAIVGASK